MSIRPSTHHQLSASQGSVSWQKDTENASNTLCGVGGYRPPFDWQRERASERHIRCEFQRHPSHEPQIR